MKNSFPRICGLSTLGIIYHFNADYRFHPFRTDFSGEGGSGKTMVADMIQLILVGSREYQSATEGNKDRPVEGMVLKPKNKQYGAGYILMNIETEPGKFIAIGAFIEKSSRQVKMFIAQAGFDWEYNLEPLSKPVQYRDLLINGKIIPIENLQDELPSIHIKSLPLKQYHRLLFENKILPVDLSEGKKTLESYANIFRSFSRGSGFKTDPENLKIFLFGDEDKNLLVKYKEEVKSINDDHKEHHRYKLEIDLISSKQDSIKEIVALQGNYKKLHYQYLSSKILFWDKKEKHYSAEFKEITKKYKNTCIERQYLNLREAELELKESKNHSLKYLKSQKELPNISVNKESLTKDKEGKYEKLQLIEEKIKNIKTVSKWLGENGNKIESVTERINSEISYKQNKELLTKFSEYLDENQLRDAFEGSKWLSEFELTKANYESYQFVNKLKLEELKALFVFSDLQNPTSLAKWAIDYFHRPLNIEEESILRYFQSLPRAKIKKPVSKNRYLPFPKELFENLDIKDTNHKGFWLNLDGVYEFVEYVPQQYLNITEQEKKKLTEKLSIISNGIKEEINTLSIIIQQEETLKTALFNFTALDKVISLYEQKEQFIKPANEEYTGIAKEELEKHLQRYADRKDIQKEYKTARKLHEDAIKAESNIDPLNFTQQSIDAKQYFSNKGINTDSLDSYLVELESKYTTQKTKWISLTKDLNISIQDASEIGKMLIDEQKNYESVLKIKASHIQSFIESENSYATNLNNLNDTKAKNKNSQLEYQTVFHKEFSFEENLDEVLQNPDEGEDNSLKSQFQRAKMAFETKYDLVAEKMEEGVQLKGTFHVGQLAHKLLPNVFVTSGDLDEKYVNEQLADKLTQLYNTVKQIGSRKIEILKRVFSEVGKTYRDYLEKVNNIDNYFKYPNKEITGGIKASLKYMPSNDYPARWMTVFNRVLDDRLTNIGLFEQLVEEIDINEMMLKAFISEGGTEEAEIEDLLNPKSYFDLSFDLHLENGESNAGSNSQTYTGNALLGLARLSLIEDSKREGIRIMPIDEAQGIGSNYEMLRKIAIEEGYQMLTMSIDTAGEIREGEQYIYILSDNKLLDEDNYVPAMGIFSEDKITPNIEDFINVSGN